MAEHDVDDGVDIAHINTTLAVDIGVADLVACAVQA